MQFSNLDSLHDHLIPLQKISDGVDFRIVGGVIRDCLLGKEKLSKDIDLTGNIHPERLWASISKQYERHTNWSIFRTEKFGTATLLKHEQNEEDRNYEITPFRKENTYEDFRHPEKIEWNATLYEDSKRRDFTINSLYRTNVINGEIADYTLNKETSCIETFIKELTIQGIGVIQAEGSLIYIVQNVQLIQEHGVLTTINNYLQNNSIPGYYTSGQSEQFDKNENQNILISILVDPHQGIQAIQSGKISTVGQAEKRLSEDPLRVLRGVRFSLTLPNKSFDFEKKTRQQLSLQSHLLEHISKERIIQECKKVIQKGKFFEYVTLLGKIGARKIVFPSIEKLVGYEQPTRYHSFDTYAHTILTVYHLQSIIFSERRKAITTMTLPENKIFIAMIAMLYHDVGKPVQYETMESALLENPDAPDLSGYKHHTILGEEIIKHEKHLQALSKQERKDVGWLIRRHHRPGEILNGSEKNKRKRLRTLISEGGIENTLTLLIIALADRLGQYNPFQEVDTKELEELFFLAKDLYDSEGRLSQNDLAVGGKEIMSQLNLSPGPIIGEYICTLFERVLGDVEQRNTKEMLIRQLHSIHNSRKLTEKEQCSS